MTAFDLSWRRRIHVVGVGGPGMNALATCLVQMGHEVSGSDIRESEVIDRLRSIGVRVNIGHDPGLVDGCDAVTSSTAIPPSNVERVSAREKGIPDLSRADMLSALCACRPTFAVAGTHGKTTTTSLLVRGLEVSGADPSYVVGADLVDRGSGARWSGGDVLVVEADESDGTHLTLPLVGTILTNIDRDHLDHYGGFDELVRGFETYLLGIEGPRVVCVDDPTIAAIVDRNPSPWWVTYGSSNRAQVRFHDVRSSDGVTTFAVRDQWGREHSVVSPLRGVHNVSNATAVIALAGAMAAGVVSSDGGSDTTSTVIPIDADHVIEAVAGFGGVNRRFQIIGEAGGATFVDDYAHLPREIDAVLTAARSSGDGWSRVVAVFQPNRFNRMATMSPEYAHAFGAADALVLTDIYASGTTPIAGVDGTLVLDAVRAARPDLEIVYEADRGRLAAVVSGLVRPGDVCVSMGCGDIETLPHEVIALRGGS